MHEEVGQFEPAERAYKEALKIKVQLENRSGEASSLGQLGNLYERLGRLEESVRFSRQAAAIHGEIGDLATEGVSRSNLALTLIALGRYDEARQELERAIVCKEPYGHASQPWTTFSVLYRLERAIGDESAAQAAQQRAFAAYLAYRRAGGENHATGGRLALAVGQAMAAGQVEHVSAQLETLRSHPDLPASFQPMISALSAILAGSRDPALAEDPALRYSDAVEITLLLESLIEG